MVPFLCSKSSKSDVHLTFMTRLTSNSPHFTCPLPPVARGTGSGSTSQAIGVRKSHQTEVTGHKSDKSHYGNNSILGGTTLKPQ